MTYSAFDTSVESGQPVELYQFTQGTTNWYYTNAEADLDYLGVTYKSAAVSRTDVNQTEEMNKLNLTLTFPRDHEFASLYLGMSPELVTTFMVKRAHTSDATDHEFVVYWRGRIMSGKATGSHIELECESVFTSIRRPGLRARYQRTCRHTLYGLACGVSQASFAVSGLVTSITGNNVVVTSAGGHPDGYFTGGMIKSPDDTLRFIVGHTGAILTLSRPLFNLKGGDTVQIFPGCDHLKATCITKFDNLLNFGGFPFIPIRNPFDGSSII